MVRKGGGTPEPGKSSGSDDREDFDETVGEFLRAYPQYNLTHIYRLSFEDGGITIDQFLSLLNTHMKREIEDKKFLAQIITGINFDEKGNQESCVSPQKSESKEFALFGDPEQYKEMSEEQKKELTQKMKNQHQMWSSHKFSKSRSIGN